MAQELPGANRIHTVINHVQAWPGQPLVGRGQPVLDVQHGRIRAIADPAGRFTAIGRNRSRDP